MNLSSVWSEDVFVYGPITLGLGALEHMTFSPDGKYIATASSQGITLWDAQTLDLVKTLRSDTEYLYLKNKKNLESARAYSNQDCGNTKRSAENVDKAKESFRELLDLKENSQKDQSTSIRFSPDGKFVTNGIEVWDMDGYRPIVAGDQISKYPFSLDDINLWLEQTPLNTLNTSFQELDLVTKERVVDAGRSNTFAIIDKSTNSTIVYGDNLVDIFAFSADGKYLILAQDYSSNFNPQRNIPICTHIQLYNLSKPEIAVKEFRIEYRKVQRLAFDPEANYFFVQTEKRPYNDTERIYLINTDSQQETSLAIIYDRESDYTFGNANNWQRDIYNNITFSEGQGNSDNYPYNVKYSDKTLNIKTLEGEKVVTIEAPTTSDFFSSYPKSVHFSPDGQTLGVLWKTVGGEGGYLPINTSVIFYDLTKEGNVLGSLDYHFDWITSVTFRPNNSSPHDNVVATTRWQAIDLWRTTWTPHPQHIRTLDVPNKLVEKIAFSPDGSFIATIGENEQILIWQIQTSIGFAGGLGEVVDTKLIFNSEGSDVRADDVAFSPDSRSVVFTGYSSSQQSESALYLWKISEDYPQIVQRAYGKVTPSPDGSELIIQSDRCAVWNIGHLIYGLYDIDCQENWRKYTFSPDSRILAVQPSNPDYAQEEPDTSYLTGAKLYHLETGQLLNNIPYDINSLDFSLEGDQLVVAGIDGLLVMDTVNHTITHKIPNSTDKPSIIQAVFTLENKIVTFHINGDILLWENADPPYFGYSPRLSRVENLKHIFDVTISFDKRIIATRNSDGTVFLFPVGYRNEFK